MQLSSLTGSRQTPRAASAPIALVALCTLLFLTFLDNTVVSVGLGNIQTDLHAGIANLQWVVGAYALTFAAIMLACGMIGDELGRKTVMLTGVAVFCAGSVLCALAPDSQVLIAGRAVMGLGAAASEPGTLSVLRHVYTDERARARAIGVWAAVSGLALALGPVIGGILVGVWSWRGIFWFNLAFGLAALIVAFFTVPESSDPHAARVDVAGSLLGAAALGTFVGAIIDAETHGFSDPVVVLMFFIAAAAAVAFVWHERRAAFPLVDLKFFRNPRFAIPNVVAFATYFATFAIFFFTALYLVEVVGSSGLKIALVFLPMTVLMIAASVVTGRVLHRWRTRWTITAGLLFYGAGLLITNLFITQQPNYPGLIVTLALVGIGIGITVVPVTTSVLDAVPPDRSGMAASVANTSREIGAVTGVTILGSLVASRLTAQITAVLAHLGLAAFAPLVVLGIETGETPTPEQLKIPGAKQVFDAAYDAFGTSVHWALNLSAILVLASAVLTAALLRDKPRLTVVPDPAPQEPAAQG